MRILIVTPSQPQATGNQITAVRYRESLERRGHAVRLAIVDGKTPTRLRQELQTFRPDIVHLLHAFRSGSPWLESRPHPSPPVVVTLTGTDIHQGIHTPGEAEVIREVLRSAAAVISQNRLTAGALAREPWEWSARIRYLPPGIVLGDRPYPLRRLHGISPEAVLFLHPAGIRPVKANLELLQIFDGVATRRPLCRIAFCGPVLDPEYARRFMAELAMRPWAFYLDVIPSAAMPAALAEADAVLNHSLCEGLPNTLIEAAALGRPILARDIPGNADVVEPGINGLIYGTAEEFTTLALRLIDSPELRRRLSRPDPERFDPSAEARALEAIYREALQTLTS